MKRYLALTFTLIMFKLTLIFLLLFLPQTAIFAEEEAAEPEDVYFELKPSIVSNLTGGPKYIRFDAQLLTTAGLNEEKIRLHVPALRHELLLLLADQDGNKLKTPDGKEAFRVAALSSLQKVMKDKSGRERINDLFFTSFYVR